MYPVTLVTVRVVLRMGHPGLRGKALEVPNPWFGTGALETIVTDLVDTMHAKRGVGLAAPQIGEVWRICVLEIQNNPRYPDFPPLPLTVLINPKLEMVAESGAIHCWEGCLSVPGLRGRVTRARAVRVVARDLTGRTLDLSLVGAHAVVAQHELDHLDGRLFIDRVDLKTLAFQQEFESFVAPGTPLLEG